jgi:hypothetical protein
MAKFDARLKARGATATKQSPVKATKESRARTALGGVGYVPDARGQLFKLILANFVGESTYHEGAELRDERFKKLARACAVQHPEWTARLAAWARSEGYMRSAPLMLAAEFIRGRYLTGLDYSFEGGNARTLVNSVLQRPDEPGEIIAYWLSEYGNPVPRPLLRGVGDAVTRMYNEYSLLKYDGNSKALRFGDVLELTHANAAGVRQGELFRYAIDRRHNRADVSKFEHLGVLSARARLEKMDVHGRREWFRSHVKTGDVAELLNEAGYTWESLSGWLQGPMDKDVWEAIIPSMGYMALLRNLRNFDEAGISDDVAESIARKLTDPEEVAKSRQFPFRFLAAYQHTHSLNWGKALEKALEASLANVPVLKGNTLILVDRSGSMYTSNGGALSDLSRADAAAVFGTALAKRAQKATLVEFGTNSQEITLHAGDSVLKTVTERFSSMGGTNTVSAINRHLRPDHNRVVIITDEQYGGYGGWNVWDGSVDTAVPAKTPLYTWNLAGYRVGQAPSGKANRHTFAGLSDAAFRMIALLETSNEAKWPWEIGE